MEASAYPALPDFSEATQIKIPQEKLMQMFYRTSFAVSREDNRYTLTGVSLHIENKRATFSGTDGKRLARNHVDIDIDPSFSGRFIIPAKAVDEILKNLGDDGEVTLSLLKDKVAVETDSNLVVTNLLTGEYPDISRVIPEKSEAVVALHREELMTLLRQVELFSSEGNNSAKFTLIDGELKLDANTRDVGEGKVSMPANYHGPQRDVAFNPSYFLDILRHSKGETVMLGVSDSFSPGVITDEGDDQQTSESSPLFILMPMRLQ